MGRNSNPAERDADGLAVHPVAIPDPATRGKDPATTRYARLSALSRVITDTAVRIEEALADSTSADKSAIGFRDMKRASRTMGGLARDFYTLAMFHEQEAKRRAT